MLNPDRQHRIDGSLFVSAFDFDPAVIEPFTFPAPFELIDSTIRKSYFTAGAITTPSGFLRMSEALAGIGVRHESVNVNWSGSPDPSPQDLALLRTVASRDFGFTLNVYADALLGNGAGAPALPVRQVIDVLQDAGARVLAPGIVEAPDAAAQERQKDQLAAYFAAASEAGVEATTITLAQVGLRDFERMVEMARFAVDLGARRLDLMDSTSSMSPDAMRVFVRRFRALLDRDVPLTMHMHDEFGLATAGAVAAVTAGASPDVAMNGMSYRCGFAPFEEVVLALEALYGVDTGIDLSGITRVSRIVAEETGLEPPPLKPLVGGYAYLKHMPGDAAAAIRTGSRAFPPISHGLVPGVIGQEVTWVWGGLSSDDMVRALAESTGIELDGAELPRVRAALDAEVAAVPAFPRWLSPDEAGARLIAAAQVVRAFPAEGDDALDAVLTAVETTPAVRDHLRAQLTGTEPAALPAALRAAVSAAPVDVVISALGALRSLADPGEPDPSTPSAVEERGLSGEVAAIRAAVVELAARYERTHGRRFAIAAAGRTGADILAELAMRTGADPAEEAAVNTGELALILQGRARAALDSAVRHAVDRA